MYKFIRNERGSTDRRARILLKHTFRDIFYIAFVAEASKKWRSVYALTA